MTKGFREQQITMSEAEVMKVLDDRLLKLQCNKPVILKVLPNERHIKHQLWLSRVKEVRQCKAWINHEFRHKLRKLNEV